tara:strand:- start:140 stop:718 length:579 start_codon:yes stop_codon:yes gene_type:complete
MSEKNSHTTADYINYEKALLVGNRLLTDPKNNIMGLYIVVSINLGLRVSDILKLTFEQLRTERIVITEQKTKKRRECKVNDSIKYALRKYEDGFEFCIKKTGLIFISQKGGVFSNQQINRRLKKIFKKESKTLNVSSHSLRKSFGRAVWSRNGESEAALCTLSEIFGHTCISVTRKYLGIRQEELDDVYMSL